MTRPEYELDYLISAEFEYGLDYLIAAIVNMALTILFLPN